jgi:AcrR family transcriptional regulator
VSVENTGRGDPQRSMALLWGAHKPPTRGPRPGLSVQRIVQTAIELADAEGLPALSMRRVAERLSVGAMSLYTYIPGKPELLDLMLDSVQGEIATQPDPGAAWRNKLEVRAREEWEMYRRHPWVLQVSGARAVLGPNETTLFEHSLHGLEGIGLSGAEMISVLTLVSGYVRGAAQGVLDAALAEQRTGLSDEEWWSQRAPLFDKYFDPAAYPTISRVYQSGAFDAPESGEDYTLHRALMEFEFGLQRVLDGVEAFVVQRAGAAS